jgi:uncharacterized protein
MRVQPSPGRGAVGSGVASPCVGLCRIDPASQWCEGCFRTLDEIAAWSALDDEAKRQVIRLLPLRQQRVFDGGQGGG